ncbi:MAG: aldehyde dehydrogenase family protein [Firmicutes bacterium]|nr:aldehyde dehydrogenase family protein [Bacillota bacterium]
MKRQVLQVTDKFTGDVVAEIPQDGRKELREKIHRAYLARDSARSLSFEERIDLIRRVGDRVAQEKEAFISLLVQQAGQARKFAEWEVERTIAQAKHFHKLVDLVRPREIPAASGKNRLWKKV